MISGRRGQATMSALLCVACLSMTLAHIQPPRFARALACTWFPCYRPRQALHKALVHCRTARTAHRADPQFHRRGLYLEEVDPASCYAGTVITSAALSRLPGCDCTLYPKKRAHYVEHGESRHHPGQAGVRQAATRCSTAAKRVR